MLIANRTSHAAVIELPYVRQRIGMSAEMNTMQIQIDLGPGIVSRAYDVLHKELDSLNARDVRWKFWSA